MKLSKTRTANFRAPSRLLLALAAATSLAAPALAQIMPAPTPLYPADPTQTLYYKDANGPGSVYVERWLPSNWGCSGLTRGTDTISQYTNPLKCVQLGPANSYVTLNGT